MPSDVSNSYSCLMSVVPEIIGHRILTWARENIDKDDLHENGFEDEPHVTILYGLHTKNADKVFDRIGDRKPLQAKMKGLSLFSNDDYDVLKINIASKDLSEINRLLRDNEEYTNSYDDYQPHCTIAYLKPGTGKKYIEKDVFTNETFWMQMMDFSDPDHNHTFKRLVDPIYKKAYLEGYLAKVAADPGNLPDIDKLIEHVEKDLDKQTSQPKTWKDKVRDARQGAAGYLTDLGRKGTQTIAARTQPGYHEGYMHDIPRVLSTYTWGDKGEGKPFFSRNPYLTDLHQWEKDPEAQRRRRRATALVNSAKDYIGAKRGMPQHYSSEVRMDAQRHAQKMRQEREAARAAVNPELLKILDANPGPTGGLDIYGDPVDKYFGDRKGAARYMSPEWQQLKDYRKAQRNWNNARANVERMRIMRGLAGDPNYGQQYIQQYSGKPTNPAPYTMDDVDAFLPGMPPDITYQQYETSGKDGTPQLDILEKTMHMPKPGDDHATWPTMWHEYAHAADPVAKPKQWAKKFIVKGTQYEPEIPAMVVENMAARSPYAAQPHAPVGPGMYDRQVARYGPQFTGNIPQDQETVQNWMKALRRVGGAKIAQQNPFAYNRDARTPQQRAQGLGRAYQNWMNWQARRAQGL